MRRRRMLTLEDIASCESGPELTPYDLARISCGQFSDETIRREIQRGGLPARVERRGTMTMHWIAFVDAKQYLLARGILHAA